MIDEFCENLKKSLEMHVNQQEHYLSIDKRENLGEFFTREHKLEKLTDRVKDNVVEYLNRHLKPKRYFLGLFKERIEELETCRALDSFVLSVPNMTRWEFERLNCLDNLQVVPYYNNYKFIIAFGSNCA